MIAEELGHGYEVQVRDAAEVDSFEGADALYGGRLEAGPNGGGGYVLRAYLPHGQP